jgi:uncharacterized protein (DUF305 family)
MTLQQNYDPVNLTAESHGPARRAGILIVILGIMILFVLLVLVLLRPGSGTTVSPDSPAASFARDMIVHHSQAVEMALLLYDRTQNETLRAIALDILLSQQNQIGQMQGWLYLWNLPIASAELPMAWMGMVVEGLMPGMATDEQMAALRDSTGEEADRLFIQLMIPHHESAIHMAQEISTRTSIPAVQNFARSVIDSQQREIRELRLIGEELGIQQPDS